jgi:small subunit ribosomal protein S18
MKKPDFFANNEQDQFINWKTISLLKRFMTRFWDVKPRKYNWNNVKNQKMMRKAILRARELWLVPYIK